MSNLGEQFSQAGGQLGGTVLTGRYPAWGNSFHSQMSNLEEHFSQEEVQLGRSILTGGRPTWRNSSERQVTILSNLGEQVSQADV